MNYKRIIPIVLILTGAVLVSASYSQGVSPLAIFKEENPRLILQPDEDFNRKESVNIITHNHYFVNDEGQPTGRIWGDEMAMVKGDVLWQDDSSYSVQEEVNGSLSGLSDYRYLRFQTSLYNPAGGERYYSHSGIKIDVDEFPVKEIRNDFYETWMNSSRRYDLFGSPSNNALFTISGYCGLPENEYDTSRPIYKNISIHGIKEQKRDHTLYPEDGLWVSDWIFMGGWRNITGATHKGLNRDWGYKLQTSVDGSSIYDSTTVNAPTREVGRKIKGRYVRAKIRFDAVSALARASIYYENTKAPEGYDGGENEGNGGIVNVDVNPHPLKGGSVKFVEGSDSILAGSEVVLKAKPNYGYEFVKWTGDVESMENRISFTPSSNTEISANFTPSEEGEDEEGMGTWHMTMLSGVALLVVGVISLAYPAIKKSR